MSDTWGDDHIVHDLMDILENRGLGDFVVYETKRRLEDPMINKDAPDENPLKEAQERLELIEREEDERLSENNRWRLVALLLADQIAQQRIRRKWHEKRLDALRTHVQTNDE